MTYQETDIKFDGKKDKPYIVLITGASGRGKTTASKALEQRLSPNLISVHYFDDIGIPSVDEMVATYGSGEKWQEWETSSWINRLARITDKRFVVLEGSFYPEPPLSRLQELGMTDYLIICIHASRNIREERLILHRKQPELATQDMENYAQSLKQKTVDLGEVVIDSSNRSAAEVAQEIANLIFKYGEEQNR